MLSYTRAATWEAIEVSRICDARTGNVTWMARMKKDSRNWLLAERAPMETEAQHSDHASDVGPRIAQTKLEHTQLVRSENPFERSSALAPRQSTAIAKPN